MLRKTFFRGFMAVLPIAITAALLIWFFDLIENNLGFLIKKIIGQAYYFPGLGIIVGLILVFIIGMVMNAWIVRKLYDIGEGWLQKIPLIKSLYGSVRDLMGFFGQKTEGRVVMVSVMGVRVLGLVTREVFDGLPLGIGADNEIAVYLPMSYQIGGFTVMIPRSQVQPINMSVEGAMRFAVTAGMLTPGSNTPKSP